MDILKEMKEGRLTSDEAQDLVDSIFAKIQSSEDKEEPLSVGGIIGMDKFEYTAYCQGADLDDLVRWRYSGWPEILDKEGNIVGSNYKNFGWFVREIDRKTVLVSLK